MLVRRSKKAERCIKERRKRAGHIGETRQDGPSSYYSNLRKKYVAAGLTPDDPV
jgi:hypothetical protein